ncbi:MAG: glycosyltransferase family 39 protein [Flavobacteriales bacterium]|nr:glycosyltransferase family 39 protein [Flavobacteriales bacterium]
MISRTTYGYWLPILMVVLTSMLSSCNEASYFLGLSNEYLTTIQTSEGLFVSADEFKKQHLIADRTTTKDWEVFTLVELSDREVLLQSSTGSFVRSDTSNHGVLIASDIMLNEANHFTVISLPEGGILLQNYVGKYVQLGLDRNLVANGTDPATAIVLRLNRSTTVGGRIFKDHELFYLVLGLLLIFISIVLFHGMPQKSILAVLLLFLGGLAIRIFMVEISDHLHWWDEQFHALVAKNMIDNPFKPMLFAHPTLDYERFSWVSGHIWLHKQPLFLWQMALSMKLFGVNTTALRLPSLVMSAIVILFIYRIGKIGFSSKAGFYGALLYALSSFGLRLTSGSINTDHNDTAFLFYVTASVWAWFEYEHSRDDRKWRWVILIGLFSGAAVLNKWLTGLLIFSAWGLVTVFYREKRKNLRSYAHILAALAINVAVFLPWQIYILQAFPELSRHEYAYNTLHFFEALEGHGEPIGYHITKIPELYGIGALALLACFLLFIKTAPKNPYRFSVITLIVVTYVFYSIPVTKMIAFTYCISFLVFLVLGHALERFFVWIVVNPDLSKKRSLTVIFATTVLVAISYWNFNLKGIVQELTTHGEKPNIYIAMRKKSTRIMKQLNERVPQVQNTVLFNCRSEDVPPALFFSDLLDAHQGYPNLQQYTSLKERNIPMAVFDSGNMPDYLQQDPQVVILHEGYWD